MASDIWLRTILIVRKETRCHHIGYSYRLTARVLLYAPSHRQDNTYHGLCYTSRGALAGTRNIYIDRLIVTDQLAAGFITILRFLRWSVCTKVYVRKCICSYVCMLLLCSTTGNQGRGMCYPVCGMMHIKEPLLLIGKSSLCGGSWFPFSLSEWSFTICLTSYNRK